MFIKITFSENQCTPHTSDTGDQKEEGEKKQQGQSRHDTGYAALGVSLVQTKKFIAR